VLYRADTPPPGEPGFHPLTLEDQVNYAGSSPWPNTTGGLSLNRRGATTWGDDSASWKGDIPSPGNLNVSYASWVAYYYPSGIADDADTDGDGASSVEEYGVATDPLVWEDHGPYTPVLTIQTIGNQTNYIFTYTKPLDRIATYTVEQSTDLATWTTAPDQFVSSTADAETRRAVVPVPPGSNKLFLRLKITTH
jgi:hypothetical protein